MRTDYNRTKDIVIGLLNAAWISALFWCIMILVSKSI